MTDPLDELGLPAGATAEEIKRAQRQLAKRHHPDVGGDAAAMQAVNAAAAEAITDLGVDEVPGTPPCGEAPEAPDQAVVADVLSFVVEALPAEAFEALLVVTASIGEIVDEDPPYLLEVRLVAPTPCWCRLDLVPDAGSSTVSLALSADGDEALPSIDAVRDRWIDELNRLDWDQL